MLLQDVSAQRLNVTEGAGPTPTAAPSAGQAKVATTSKASMAPGGEQAAVGTGGYRLALQPVHPSLPPFADALRADAAAPTDSADQHARKREMEGSLDVSGTVSCFLQAALSACNLLCVCGVDCV